jgi:hypothetical protein
MKLFIPAAALVLLASCAATPTTMDAEVAEPRVMRTGSHLPVRDNQVPNVQSDPAHVIISAPAPYIPGKGGGAP